VLRAPRRQFRLLERAPAFRVLFLAALASNLGTWIAVVALTVDVYDRTHSAKWVSALLVADFLPAVAIGLLLGPLVDRLSRRGLLIGADLGRLVVFCGLAFTTGPGQIVALAAAAGFATGFFRPAVLAGLPNLVSDEDLPDANSMLRSIENVGWTLGTLIGGAIVAVSGPHLAYLLNAASFLISALLIVQIAARLLQREQGGSRGHWLDLQEGFSVVFHSRALVAVFVSWNLVMLSNAGVNVAEIVLAKASFNAGSFGYGLLWAGSGVGMIIGSVYAPTWVEQRGVSFVYAAALGLMAFGALAASLAPNVWVATACMAIGGSGNGSAIVCNILLVQRGAPDRVRGRALTTIMSANFALLGLGMAVWGPITDAVGARWVFGAAAGLAAVAALVGRSLTRKAAAAGEMDEGAHAVSAPG
jgi:MFS family permease